MFQTLHDKMKFAMFTSEFCKIIFMCILRWLELSHFRIGDLLSLQMSPQYWPPLWNLVGLSKCLLALFSGSFQYVHTWSFVQILWLDSLSNKLGILDEALRSLDKCNVWLGLILVLHFFVLLLVCWSDGFHFGITEYWISNNKTKNRIWYDW